MELFWSSFAFKFKWAGKRAVKHNFLYLEIIYLDMSTVEGNLVLSQCKKDFQLVSQTKLCNV